MAYVLSVLVCLRLLLVSLVGTSSTSISYFITSCLWSSLYSKLYSLLWRHKASIKFEKKTLKYDVIKLPLNMQNLKYNISNNILPLYLRTYDMLDNLNWSPLEASGEVLISLLP